MHAKRPPLPVIVILLLVLLVGGYYGLQILFDESNGALQASGTIEVVDISVSPEMAGKVLEVLVDEGQPIHKDDLLLRLDDSLLQSEKNTAQFALDSAYAASKTAEVTLESAQLQYVITLTNALAQESTARTEIWNDSKPTQFEQPVWYFSKNERIQAAQAEVIAKKASLDDAAKKLDETSKRAGSSEFLEIEARLVQMRLAFENAQTVFDDTNSASDSQNLRDAAQIILDESEIDLKDAQEDYDDALTTEGATDILEARAEVVVAQEVYDRAVDYLRSLQTGADSQLVQMAEMAVEQAKTALEQVKTNIASTQSRINQIETQLKKSIIYSPADGTILTRNVEPGEFVQPGATLFTLANLDDLTITVFIPEDRYGEISLGQQAEVKVDSFPGETFSAQVTFIADTAEYTPRNVQTVEGRSATVYAIKLKVNDPSRKLKPGMPADVTFSH